MRECARFIMSKMTGELKQIVLKPAKHDKDGRLVDSQYASVNINLDMATPEDEKKIAKLFLCLDNGNVVVTIDAVQPRLFGDKEDDDGVATG